MREFIPGICALLFVSMFAVMLIPSWLLERKERREKEGKGQL
jgi:hypothetical protein